MNTYPITGNLWYAQIIGLVALKINPVVQVSRWNMQLNRMAGVVIFKDK